MIQISKGLGREVDVSISDVAWFAVVGKFKVSARGMHTCEGASFNVRQASRERSTINEIVCIVGLKSELHACTWMHSRLVMQ